tara:strand:- start:18 stop:1061 length:1044 start_codon:yes stop_codon:yes gene_type:complete
MIRLAIVGTGNMANTHANEFNKIEGVKIVAACDISKKNVEEFAGKHKIKKTFLCVSDLLNYGDFDAVANVTPDRFHFETSVPFIDAGKHVLCEKPLAENYPDSLKMAELAESKRIVNMVNFSYRNASAINKTHKLINENKIGKIIHVEASYLQSWLVSKAWGEWEKESKWLWRLSSKHGSKGVLGDVGVHILDFATYPVGEVKRLNCFLKTFENIKGSKIGEYQLDANDSAIINLEFKNGALGTIQTTRWAVGHHNTLELGVFGSKGAIKVNLDESQSELKICTGKNIDAAKWEKMDCGNQKSIYELFIQAILNDKQENPNFRRGSEIQKLLEICEKSHCEGKILNV